MRPFRYLLVTCLLLTVLTAVDAQTRGRDRGGRSPREARAGGGSDFKKLVDNGWLGVGGTLSFFQQNSYNSTVLGLSPMAGYKFLPWLSAGPRLGVLYNGIKGRTTNGSRQRANLWDYSVGAFARAKVYAFYVQTEYNQISRENLFIDQSGLIALDPNTSRPSTDRSGEQELLVGIGYNPGSGSVSSDFGVFYNLFDDVNSQQSAIQIRVMLTFGY